MSSNKNWTSMFKSKSCNNYHHEIDTPSYMHYSNCNISSSFSSGITSFYSFNFIKIYIVNFTYMIIKYMINVIYMLRHA